MESSNQCLERNKPRYEKYMEGFLSCSVVIVDYRSSGPVIQSTSGACFIQQFIDLISLGCPRFNTALKSEDRSLELFVSWEANMIQLYIVMTGS
jgi:hypothetical protein